jgi:hypothetical protein
MNKLQDTIIFDKLHLMKSLKKTWLWLGLIVLFFCVCAWPIRWAFTPKFLTQTHLILLTNEAETRPCGGFVTAIGEARILPLKMKLRNAYALADKSFGTAQAPLNMVAKDVKFWDLGTSPDLKKCADSFRGAANMAKIKHSRVVLINTKTVEKIIKDSSFFANMTRTVANTDRHDEQSLAERKSPLSQFGKKMVVKILIKPWTWPRITQEIGHAVKTGELYISDISPELKPLSSDIAAIEWNLGGGKSSRFLERNLDISARETSPNNWKIKVKARLEHLGQADEPLSQTWKGGIEMRWPNKWNYPNEFLSLTLSPGENWWHEWTFEISENMASIGVFAPRGQTWNTDLRLSLFGQQTFDSSTFETHENVGTWSGKLRTEQKNFHWVSKKDFVNPFITLHEWLTLKQIPEKARQHWGNNFTRSSARFSVAELHFSEPVLVTKNLKITFRDKDFENTEITEPPIFDELLLWNGEQTALIGFWQDSVQPNERFTVRISGLSDIAGNEISDREYTIIDRH